MASDVERLVMDWTPEDLLDSAKFVGVGDGRSVNILERILGSLACVGGYGFVSDPDAKENTIRALVQRQPRLITEKTFAQAREFQKYHHINLISIFESVLQAATERTDDELATLLLDMVW